MVELNALPNIINEEIKENQVLSKELKKVYEINNPPTKKNKAKVDPDSVGYTDQDRSIWKEDVKRYNKAPLAERLNLLANLQAVIETKNHALSADFQNQFKNKHLRNLSLIKEKKELATEKKELTASVKQAQSELEETKRLAAEDLSSKEKRKGSKFFGSFRAKKDEKVVVEEKKDDTQVAGNVKLEEVSDQSKDSKTEAPKIKEKKPSFFKSLSLKKVSKTDVKPEDAKKDETKAEVAAVVLQ